MSNQIIEKKCFKCKKIKPIDNFRQCKNGINKGYYHSYCNECSIIYTRNYKKENPWTKTLNAIRTRCNNKNHSYGRRGIKAHITRLELKELWFRDKAYLMKQPSIDRIDTTKHYIKENCRFLEMPENRIRRWEKQQKQIIQKTLDGKIVKEYECVGDAVKAFGKDKQCRCSIVNALSGRRKNCYGYKWEYKND